MSVQVLNPAEMSEVSGGLSIAIGDNPILNARIDVTPGGTFTLLGSLVGGALNFVRGLLRSV